MLSSLTDSSSAQWLFTLSDLNHTPSVIAGLSPSQERENRAKGVNFIWQAGIMLKLPQITIATASVYLHRFFMRFPMVEDRIHKRQHQHYYSIAATCLFLATKVEENCRKMKDLVVACVRVAQKEPNKEVDEQDKEFWRWRDCILALEDVLLEALCFDLALESPYTALYNLLVAFGEENNKPLRNAAWAFVNDSCHTHLCLLFPARTIAASAIYAAARHADVRLLDDEFGRPWWEVARVDLVSMRRACNFMADVYENVARGGDKGILHTHTPEDGDEMDAKTREVRTGDILPMPARTPRDNGSNGSVRGGSVTGSEGGRKREREQMMEGEEDGEVVENNWGGSSVEDGRESKRVKIENGTGGNVPLRTNGTNGSNGIKAEANEGKMQNGIDAKMDDAKGGLVSPKLDDGSEEGELEQ